ncbi:GTP-binding protein [Halobacillus litoralis]|uniref:GTP-binding protein n=1 Tax=Halobacillus litoralis TaxID=45668 RepID=A0A845F8X4_9BACI|nr:MULTISPECIES: putative glycoside hydrolase [Halobacillus]MEC3883592.1 putative glycoside hydrolase [Halobacillus sp. HZG1]MYL70278.1 GTP-binding protein [Halobacillus litoralis]
MGKRQLWMIIFTGILFFGMMGSLHNVNAEDGEGSKEVAMLTKKQLGLKELTVPSPAARFTYNSGLSFEYPDAVRGIFVTGPSAGGAKMAELTKLVEDTELNAMVIDIKEDNGNITFEPEEGSPYADVAEGFIDDPRAMLEELEEKGIYPIARVVVFKDSLLAEKRPDLSFTQNGQVWKNGKGESFVNPFMEEVWEYNVELAKIAAEMGFEEIQYDYVRFPEGFGSRDDVLEYGQGKYGDMDMDNVQKRVQAVTDFVEYASKELEYYGVDVSVDIFGYAATITEAPNIGQNFSKISSNVDVISSMIYPSHWGPYFGISKPDTEPYRLISEYAKVENEVLAALENSPTSRPWLQDFEAPWLYSGPTKQYGKAEVEAQIRALNENGINEFLLWNAGNNYTKNVDYTPLD